MIFVFFFFQAEDGIRDDLVTGVQTCALPILALQGHWSFTARLDVRFRQPVPVGARIEVVARQVRDRGRFVEADGEARLPDGQVVAEVKGLFLKLQPDEEATLRRTIWPDSGAADGDAPAAEGQ